jgi:hypothetical protein
VDVRVEDPHGRASSSVTASAGTSRPAALRSSA